MCAILSLLQVFYLDNYIVLCGAYIIWIYIFIIRLRYKLFIMYNDRELVLVIRPSLNTSLLLNASEKFVLLQAV